MAMWSCVSSTVKVGGAPSACLMKVYDQGFHLASACGIAEQGACRVDKGGHVHDAHAAGWGALAADNPSWGEVTPHGETIQRMICPAALVPQPMESSPAISEIHCVLMAASL